MGSDFGHPLKDRWSIYLASSLVSQTYSFHAIKLLSVKNNLCYWRDRKNSFTIPFYLARLKKLIIKKLTKCSMRGAYRRTKIMQVHFPCKADKHRMFPYVWVTLSKHTRNCIWSNLTSQEKWYWSRSEQSVLLLLWVYSPKNLTAYLITSKHIIKLVMICSFVYHRMIE